MSLSRPSPKPSAAPTAPVDPFAGSAPALSAQVGPDPAQAAPPGTPPPAGDTLPAGAPGSAGGGMGPPPGPGEGEGADLRVPTLADGGTPLDPTQNLAPGGEVGTTPLQTTARSAPPAGLSGSGDVSDSVSPTVFIALGGALLVGALLYWVFGGGRWGGGRPGGDRRSLERLRPAAEPGLLHPALPSLSDGLAVWVVAPELQDALIHVLLAELARGRSVLVAAPARVVLPLVHGGPVYRVEGGRPAQLRRSAAGLGPEARAAALIVGPEGAAPGLEDWSGALPAGVGGVVVLSERPAGWSAPIVELRRAEGEDGALQLVLGGRQMSARFEGGHLRLDRGTA